MTDGLWDHRNTEGWTPGADLTGYRVEAKDGHIGKVDRHTAEVDVAHLVVDTGPWIFGREVLLPAGLVRRVDTEERTVWVDRTKDEVKNAPAYLRDRHTGDPDYRQAVGGYYGGIV